MSAAPPLALSREPGPAAALAAELAGAGWRVQDGFAVGADWRLAARRLVCHGRVAAAADAEAAVLAAARGAGIVAVVADPAVLARLHDDLARLGAVRLLEAGTPAALGPEERRVLELIAGGATLAEAARALNWSDRTIVRRLAAARAALGVSTTAEAAARWRRES